MVQNSCTYENTDKVSSPERQWLMLIVPSWCQDSSLVDYEWVLPGDVDEPVVQQPQAEGWKRIFTWPSSIHLADIPVAWPFQADLGPLLWLNFHRSRMDRLPGWWVFHQRSPQSWNEVIACHPGYEAWPKRLITRVKEISLKFTIKIHVHLHSTLRYRPVYFNAHLPLKS